jgi:hypothetical protein
MMGPGIAATFALAGLHASILRSTHEGATRGVATAKSLIEISLTDGLADPSQAQNAGAHLAAATDVESTARAAQLNGPILGSPTALCAFYGTAARFQSWSATTARASWAIGSSTP